MRVWVAGYREPPTASAYSHPSFSFGTCDTNDQAHADAWATSVCVANGWTSGVWTGNKMGGCGNGTANGEASVSMWCGGQIPCDPTFESVCTPTDQTLVELTCSM